MGFWLAWVVSVSENSWLLFPKHRSETDPALRASVSKNKSFFSRYPANLIHSHYLNVPLYSSPGLISFPSWTASFSNSAGTVDLCTLLSQCNFASYVMQGAFVNADKSNDFSHTDILFKMYLNFWVISRKLQLTFFFRRQAFGRIGTIVSTAHVLSSVWLDCLSIRRNTNNDTIA